MKRLIIFLLCLDLGLQAQNGNKGNVLTDANDAAKLVLAKQKLLGGQYISALNLYREVLSRNPNDALTKYYVGLCQFHLQKYEEAKKTLEEAALLPDARPQTYLVLGKIHQINEEFDEALKHLAKFKSSNAASEEEALETELLTSQCGNAVSFMQNPAAVK